MMSSERVFSWFANATYRRRQVALLLGLGAVFTGLGGFAATERFVRQLASEYYLLQGEKDAGTPQGRQAIEQAIALRPTWARAHLSLAQIYYNSGWLAGTVQETERAFALAEDPAEQSLAVYVGALAQLKAGRARAALDALKLAVELDPRNALAQAQLQQLQSQRRSGGSRTYSRPRTGDG